MTPLTQTPNANTGALRVRGLRAWQGPTPVLHGLDFDIEAGQTVALLGRNGSGRSTTAQALMGLVQTQGQVLWQGSQWVGQPTHAVAQAGMGYVPEHKDIFPNLSVQENLELGLRTKAQRRYWDWDTAYAHFPILAERRQTLAGRLSGGEQQMLTLCRTLMGNPDLVLLDEPTEGLAPHMVEQVARCCQTLQREGVGLLLIEHKRQIAWRLAQRVFVLGQGRIVFDGTPQELDQSPHTRQQWLEA
jgi:branched-chain amino acid transport system ATP-binding protein